MEEPFGPYRLLERLGEGGMNEVFLARREDDPASEPVVLKRVVRRQLSSDELIDMFLLEARIALRLQHPNIVDVHDVGTIDERHYMVMERVVGMDLFDLTAARSPEPLPPGVVCRILLDVCAGLEYVHQTGLVHSDVNPHNVIVTIDGSSKVTDFGIAVLENVTDQRVRGTPAYMAPEQVLNTALDRRTDVFALGIILWELLANQRLYGGHPPYVSITKIVEEEPPSLGDRDTDEVALRALAKTPDDRFASCAELAAAIEELAARKGWPTDVEQVRTIVASANAA